MEVKQDSYHYNELNRGLSKWDKPILDRIWKMRPRTPWEEEQRWRLKWEREHSAGWRVKGPVWGVVSGETREVHGVGQTQGLGRQAEASGCAAAGNKVRKAQHWRSSNQYSLLWGSTACVSWSPVCLGHSSLPHRAGQALLHIWRFLSQRASSDHPVPLRDLRRINIYNPKFAKLICK